jgi:hypothetical protein
VGNPTARRLSHALHEQQSRGAQLDLKLEAHARIELQTQIAEARFAYRDAQLQAQKEQLDASRSKCVSMSWDTPQARRKEVMAKLHAYLDAREATNRTHS